MPNEDENVDKSQELDPNEQKDEYNREKYVKDVLADPEKGGLPRLYKEYESPYLNEENLFQKSEKIEEKIENVTFESLKDLEGERILVKEIGTDNAATFEIIYKESLYSHDMGFRDEISFKKIEGDDISLASISQWHNEPSVDLSAFNDQFTIYRTKTP